MKEVNISDFIVTNPVNLNEIPTMPERGKSKKGKKEALNKTSLPYAPWYIIPADDKHVARYHVVKIIYEKMVQYDDITEPLPDDNLLKNIEIYKEKLLKKVI